jgi:dihydrofolate synthase/folylpolyglutamate synthase
MNQKEVMSYLEDIKKYGSVPGLSSITSLLDALGNPQDQLRVIHIAGTNGKGSILAMLESVLRCSGYKTGRYHSPVLFDTREAFQVNQEWIPMDKLCLHVEKVRNAAKQMQEEGYPHPTSFEVETAVAFSYFLEEKVDVVLLETGMGGRLDATNVVKKPLVEILASISLDHMQFLGNTITEIAKEKAGIIKENTDVILYPSSEEIVEAVKEEALLKHAHLCMADQSSIRILSQNVKEQSFSYRSRSGHYYEKITIPLSGDHQIFNAVTVLEVLEVLKKYFCMGIFEIEKGMREVKWPGRLEIIAEYPYVIRDGAHNEDAARKLAGFLEKNFTNKRILYIIGVLRDKEYEKILSIMSPYSDDVYTVASDSPRALSAEALAECAKADYAHVTAFSTVREAIENALSEADKDDVILIFGSLSFMKEIEEMRNDGTLSKSCSS